MLAFSSIETKSFTFFSIKTVYSPVINSLMVGKRYCAIVGRSSIPVIIFLY
jgi:hypothetical protein